MPKKFYCTNPTYIIVGGAPNTPVASVRKAIGETFAAVRKHGRNPVLASVVDNGCSTVAQDIADAQHIPVLCGDVDTIVKELDGRKLREDHIQMVLFQTPEYAGSQEALDLLYGCRQLCGTLRMFSVYHRQWMNSNWNSSWVPEFNNKFLRTLNSYSLTDKEKSEIFSKRIRYIQKYPSLYKSKRTSGVSPVPASKPIPPATVPKPSGLTSATSAYSDDVISIPENYPHHYRI